MFSTMFNHRNHSVFLALAILTLCVAFIHGHSLQKRDLDEIKDAIDKQIPQGGMCATDDQCSFVEYCHRENLAFKCELQPWFIWTLVGVAIFIVLSLGLSCICCPCCCLYAMCRKS